MDLRITIVRIFDKWVSLPVREKGQALANLKRNWYFPVSALAFFCLNARLNLGFLLGMLIAFSAAVLAASQIPSVWSFTREKPAALRGLSLLTALGICWAGYSSFYAAWSISSKTQALAALLPFPVDVAAVFSVCGAVCAVFFVYFCVVLFWHEMMVLVKESNPFGDITKPEWAVYGVLFAGSLVMMAVLFSRTGAFYGTELDYDILYTSDSPALVKGNAYLSLTHLENDLRQPLFAVFAAPFVGLPYFLGKLLGGPVLQAVLMNSVQILLLFAANFLLAKMLKLTPVNRVCFLLLTTATYTNMLFTLMMEQYIVAYFWMILCMYLITENRPSPMVLWGAGGTLLTSMVLLPFMPDKHPVKQFKEWFWDMVKLGLSFVALMLAFCRFDVIYELLDKIADLSTFGGTKLTLAEKFFQYSAFAASCFTAPAAGINTTAVDHISWQLQPVTGIDLAGVAILALALIGAIVSRKEKISQFAAAWIALSAVMLLVLGWGTSENGLILYGLYFGWAFLALLMQLVKTIENRLNVGYLTPAVCVAGAIALAVVNIPAILEMVQFAITHYPA